MDAIRAVGIGRRGEREGVCTVCGMCMRECGCGGGERREEEGERGVEGGERGDRREQKRDCDRRKSDYDRGEAD